MTRTEAWSGDPREPDDELHDDARDSGDAVLDAAAEPAPSALEDGETGEAGSPGEWITGWDPEAHPGPLE